MSQRSPQTTDRIKRTHGELCPVIRKSGDPLEELNRAAETKTRLFRMLFSNACAPPFSEHSAPPERNMFGRRGGGMKDGGVSNNMLVETLQWSGRRSLRRTSVSQDLRLLQEPFLRYVTLRSCFVNHKLFFLFVCVSVNIRSSSCCRLWFNKHLFYWNRLLQVYFI